MGTVNVTVFNDVWMELERRGFRRPRTLEEAESRLTQVTLEVQDIQAQLALRNRTDNTGRRLGPVAYANWRSKAVVALNSKLREQRGLRMWAKQERIRLRSQNTDGTDRTLFYLRNLHRIFHSVMRYEGLELSSADDIRVVEEVREHIMALDQQERAYGVR
jgi:hypothetical protein